MEIRLFWLLVLFILVTTLLIGCRDGIVLQPVEPFPMEKIETPVEQDSPEQSFKTVVKKAISAPYVMPVFAGIILLFSMSWILKLIYRLTTTSP